ncbi:MAG: aromatic amino acid lyase [Rhodospirillales bacterium]
MTILLNDRDDFTLTAFAAVSRKGEGVRIDEPALARMREARSAFLRHIEDPDVVVYGVTSGYGQMAHLRFTPEERKRHAARPPRAAAVSFGKPLPERVTRGMVLARLVNFVSGYSAISPDLAVAVAAMLDGGRLPDVPLQGNGGAGEILPLSHLFGPVAELHPLAEKDSLCLVNGSPGATALLADAALSAATLCDVTSDVFALAWEAFNAPLDHLDPVLDDLWGDPAEAWALEALRTRLGAPVGTRRPYQAPVSFRILPRYLGRLRRAAEEARVGAETALRAVTDNPVFLPPDDNHPNGRALSTGGYQNAAAAPSMDGLTAAVADLCTLAVRQTSKMLDGNVSKLPHQLLTGPDDDRYLGTAGFAGVGFEERARLLAQPTLLPGGESGGYGQNDVASVAFPAWEKWDEAGDCLDACLAMLAVIASQALYVTDRAPDGRAGEFLERVRDTVPPLDEGRAMGPDYQRLAETFGISCET